MGSDGTTGRGMAQAGCSCVGRRDTTVLSAIQQGATPNINRPQVQARHQLQAILLKRPNPHSETSST